MSVRFQCTAAAMVLAPLLGLSGCGTVPVVAAAPAGPFIVLNPPHSRSPRPNPCRIAKPDLTPERKEALFRQFTSELASDPALLAAASTSQAGAPPATQPGGPDGCKQAER